MLIGEQIGSGVRGRVVAAAATEPAGVHFVIVVDTGRDGSARYVVGRVRLGRAGSAPGTWVLPREWDGGRYVGDYQDALSLMVQRAGARLVADSCG